MGNPFFDLLNMDWNSSKNKSRIEIWTFLFQICFRNQIWTSGSGQTENTRICLFSVWPLPEVQNLFRKQIWNENDHILFLNFFFEEFRSISKNFKKWISHSIKKIVISKWPMAVWKILQTGSFLGKNGRKTGNFSAKNGRKTGTLKFCFSFLLAVFTVLQVHPKTRLSITWPRELLLLWFKRFTVINYLQGWIDVKC